MSGFTAGVWGRSRSQSHVLCSEVSSRLAGTAVGRDHVYMRGGTAVDASTGQVAPAGDAEQPAER